MIPKVILIVLNFWKSLLSNFNLFVTFYMRDEKNAFLYMKPLIIQGFQTEIVKAITPTSSKPLVRGISLIFSSPRPVYILSREPMSAYFSGFAFAVAPRSNLTWTFLCLIYLRTSDLSCPIIYYNVWNSNSPRGRRFHCSWIMRSMYVNLREAMEFPKGFWLISEL